MDTMEERDDREGDKGQVRSVSYNTILALAKALRSEFGNAIDAHPGGIGTEAGAINRAFRLVACVILKEAGSLEDDQAGVMGWVLRQVALGRLEELGVVGSRA